jgi:hypothetical protein
MSRIACTTSIAVLLFWSSLAVGHGTPIVVGVDGGRLMVSGGVADSAGFVSMMYVETDADGDWFSKPSPPAFGPVVLWQIPGFDIDGMNNNSSLSLEVLLRPVAYGTPQEYRTMWYWSPTTGKVEPAAPESAIYLLARQSRSLSLRPNDVVAPPPLLLAATMEDEQGFHNHNLMFHTVDDSPAAADGAYGYFARLTSDLYEPSDPFLVVLNYNTDYSRMIEAASEINFAAFLAGDYNRDGSVNAVDYTVWRNTLGSAEMPLAADGDGNGVIEREDYAVWKAHYGDVFPDGAGSSSGSAIGSFDHAVPEPATLAYCFVVALPACTLRPARKKFLRRRCLNQGRHL